MQIVGYTLHTGHGDCYKANIDDERDSGEDEGESGEDQCANPKTAVLAERRGDGADHYKESQNAEYWVED